MSAIELLRHATELLAAEQASRPKYLRAVSSDRDDDRCNSHAAFLAVVEFLETHGWSRNRISETLRVDPTTLKDWIETGDKKRNQLPGWIFSAMSRLPAEAWEVLTRELGKWRDAAKETEARGG